MKIISHAAQMNNRGDVTSTVVYGERAFPTDFANWIISNKCIEFVVCHTKLY